ncbi:MAG: MFS transporter [Phenylobacterium sp.]
MSGNSGRRRSVFLIAVAGLIGNVVEWYDFAIYGNFAIIIGAIFFPSSDPRISLVASFGAFASGFIARPVGGILFGRLGDAAGRQVAMTVSVLAMAVPTFLVALLPGVDRWGVWAPVSLIALRLIQGLSVGGEYTSSLIFLAEQSDPRFKARMSVWGVWGAVFGMLLGSLAALGMAAWLGEATLRAWGWRALFATGGFVALSGVFIRRLLPREAAAGEAKAPIADAFRNHWGKMLVIAATNIGPAVAFYTVIVYAMTYVRAYDNYTRISAIKLNMFTMGVMLIALPIAAWISDRCGARRVIVAGLIVSTLLSVGLYRGIDSNALVVGYLWEALVAAALALTMASLVVFNVELLPVEVRCTGLAIAYNAAVGLFGGSTPLVSTWLIKSTGDPVSPSYWLGAALLLSTVTVLMVQRGAARQRAAAAT